MQIAAIPKKLPREAAAINAVLRLKYPELASIPWAVIEDKSEREIADIFGRSTIVLSLPFLESFGLVPLEAMASGAIVVGFHGHGALEYATSENGFWFPSDHIEETADALAHVIRALQAKRPCHPQDARDRTRDRRALQQGRRARRLARLLRPDAKLTPDPSSQDNMRRDPSTPAGTVHRLTLKSDVLADNFLRDPATRAIDVYVPHGHSGRGLPLLVDLVGFTAGGPAHTNWRNFTENIPEQADRLIASGAMKPAVIAFPDCFTKLGGNQYINSAAIGRWADFLIAGSRPLRRAEIRLRRHGQARRLRQVLGRLRRDRARDALSRFLGGLGDAFGRRGVRAARAQRHAARAARARQGRRQHPALARSLLRQAQGEGRRRPRADVARDVRDLRSRSHPVHGHPSSRRSRDLRGHPGALGQLDALGPAHARGVARRGT